MIKLFAFNTLAGSSRSATSVVDGDATGGRFDPAYVGSAILVPTGGFYLDTTPFIDGSASQAALWIRFDMYGLPLSGSNGGAWMEFINSTGVVVARLSPGRANSNNFFFEQWNGAAYNSTTVAYAGAAAALRTWAVRIVCGASGTLELYQTGSLLQAFAINQASVNNVAKVRLYAPSNVNAYYSQVMGADSDIRDAHMNSKLATGEGTYTAGTGVYTDINEAVLDDTTAISLAASGDKHTFVHGAVALAGGQQIGSVIVNARGRIGAGVTDGKLMVRSGSTDSASGGKVFNSGYEPRGHAFDNDPATGNRWAAAAAGASEFGLQAA